MAECLHLRYFTSTQSLKRTVGVYETTDKPDSHELFGKKRMRTSGIE